MKAIEVKGEEWVRQQRIVVRRWRDKDNWRCSVLLKRECQSLGNLLYVRIDY
jgi:hypothetical protein